MKNNLIEELRSIFEQSKTWLKLEIEYAKLTVAEKLTILLGSLILGFVCLLFGLVVLILLSFSLAEAFKLIINPALAYLSTAGVIVVLLAALFMLRKPILLNPFARMITRIFFDKNNKV